jgi:anti-sigma B factor antagonist
MHLEITQRERDGIVILDLNGKLIMGAADSLARQRILDVIDAGNKKLILDLKHVADIDTSGLGTLAFCATKVGESGGRLVLVQLGTAHAKLSDVFKLSTAFEIYEDEIDAVNSFFPDRAIPRYDILSFVEEQAHKAER